MAERKRELARESFSMNFHQHEQELKTIIKGEVLFDPINKALFSTAACIFRIVPMGVISPKSQEDVIGLVRYAIEHGIPITPRAGGSSLAGQSIGEGIVIDFKRYMDNILGLNINEKWVKVQPGVIYANLNRYLKPHGFFFPPNPSSGNFCCLGGMAGTNGAGPHTLKYGSTKDYVSSIQLVTGKGDCVTIKPMDITQEGAAYSNTAEEILYHSVWKLLSTQKQALTGKKHLYNKNSCGYNVWEVFKDNIVPTRGGLPLRGPLVCDIFDLTRLITGSEGTLGVITDLTLNIAPLPKSKGAALLYFDSWANLGEAVSEIVNLGACAAEVMDKTFLSLVRKGAPHLSHLWPEEAEAVLLIEFEGENDSQTEDLLRSAASSIVEKMQLANGVKYAKTAAEQEDVWNLRKAAYPLLYKADPNKKPMNFIDDAALPLDKLNIYLERLRQLFAKYELDAVIYGHAGNGNLHVNPLMNPNDPKFERTLQGVADEGFSIAMELGGTITGEHGDGILRAPYVKRQYPQHYSLFKDIKSIFDPKGIMNPGKIITDNYAFPLKQLRYKRNFTPTRTIFDNENLRTEIEKCHGCGSCRSYCPVAQHVPKEDATARAKASLLKAALHGEIPAGDLSSSEAKAIADLCYNCKRCLTQCPTAVDIPRLATKIKEMYVETHGQSFTNWLLGNSQFLFTIGNKFPLIANFLAKNSFSRQIMEWLTGIDKRRILPIFSNPVSLKKELLKIFGQNGKPLSNITNKKIIYFPGCFAQNLDSKGEGLATLQVLKANGIDVIIPDKLACCGVAKISLGSGRDVLHDIRHNVEILSHYVALGYPIITSSPSCGLAIKKEWYEYLPEPQVAQIASNCFDLMEYLNLLDKKGELNTNFQKVKTTLAYHNPCHAAAQGLTVEPIAFLKRIPGVNLVEIEDGCSGMAGTFGMKQANFDLSMKIGQELFDKIKSSGVSLVATGCGSCNLQIKQGTNANVTHPAVIIAQAYGFTPSK